MSTTGTFRERVEELDFRRAAPEILQVNVGKVCNQTCVHCHVDAGPRRTEDMPRETAEAALSLLDKFDTIHTLDITGGAPELNANFRMLAKEGTRRGMRVIDRCNLTILFEPGQEDLADFLAEHKVEIIASLPCYLEENVDKQRGRDVFRKSIDALRLLNEKGYGRGGELVLNLVFNPTGLGLPPEQSALELDYKKHLERNYGVTFDSLITITNMPISRFERYLRTTGEYDNYMQKLVDAFNPATVPQLMCRNTLSVSWDGFLYDCDFNQMLDMRIGDGEPLRVETLTPKTWAAHQILTGEHCFGCTAGAGSSCGGSLVK